MYNSHGWYGNGAWEYSYPANVGINQFNSFEGYLATCSTTVKSTYPQTGKSVSGRKHSKETKKQLRIHKDVHCKVVYIRKK